MNAFPCSCWRPPAAAPTPWAALALVHGIGGHGEAFAPLGQELAAQGVVVCAVDLPGHGRWPGPRGALKSRQELDAAVEALLHSARAEAGGLPLFLLGHSLGGTIVLEYVQAHPGCVRGTVVTNPALAVEPSWRLQLAQLLGRVWPGFTLRTGIDRGATAHDPLVLERIRQDPLRHDLCSVRLASVWQAMASRLMEASAWAPQPLLVLLSRHDPVIVPLAVEHYVSRAAGRDVTLRIYENSLHELLDDRERRQVIAALLSWMRLHSA